MAGRMGASSSSPLQKSLPPQAIILMVVVLIGILGWMAYRTFGPVAPAKTFTVQQQKEWVAELAKQSGGDFSRLTPEQQNKVNAISLGNGARYLKSAYEKQK